MDNPRHDEVVVGIAWEFGYTPVVQQEIVEELSAVDPMWKKIAASYYAFMEQSTRNQFVTEMAHLKTRDL